MFIHEKLTHPVCDSSVCDFETVNSINVPQEGRNKTQTLETSRPQRDALFISSCDSADTKREGCNEQAVN